MTERIASLGPGATEILCALGLADRIVGISHACNFPPEIADRPRLTEPAHNGGAPAPTSGAGSGQTGMARLNSEALRRARPDLIVIQEGGDGRDVGAADVRQALATWPDDPPQILTLQPARLADIFDDIARIAGATGRDEAACHLVGELRARLDRIRDRAASVRSHPRVACIEWMDPLKVAGNWVPELVDLAGGGCDLVSPGRDGIGVSWSDLVTYQPDVMVVMPRGFTLARTRREVHVLTERPEWTELPAVRNKRAYSADGNSYLDRPGPRIAEGAELLAGLIQPSFFASRIPPGSYEPVR